MMKKDDFNIAVVGLGYVGLPLAVELCKKYNVIGYDLDNTRVNELNSSYDRTNELSEYELSNQKNITFSSNKKYIKNSNVYIITVPTPVDKNNKPDLSSIISATQMVGKYLVKDDIVVYESTVFPGCTEKVCVPILEEVSKLKYIEDFGCGYSPERVNPGDKNHRLSNIVKVVSASDRNTLETLCDIYGNIIEAGIHKAPNIAVAEAAKVIENTQRDVNISLVNELALIFDKLGINTTDVLEAASTKWNFLPFKPGLVGGHCIGVDPYYLTHVAMEVGHHPEIILAGRKINDGMSNFIVEKTISELVKQKINPAGANISVLGLSFKENCPDIRNTKVLTVIEKLGEYNCNITISDPYVVENEAKKRTGIKLKKINKIFNQDALVFTVCHSDYLKMPLAQIKSMLKPGGIIIDVKSIFHKDDFEGTDFRYWSL